MNDYIAAVLFFLPAGIANLVPPLANKIPVLNQWKTPLDFGKSYKGKRIFGDNKTWRGLVIGVMAAMLSAVAIAKLNQNVVGTSSQLAVGFMLGFGSLLGDAIESFIKRQIGIKPGQSWMPYDQLDYIIGGLIFVSFVVVVPAWAILTIIFVYFGLHFIFSYLGYLFGFKQKPI